MSWDAFDSVTVNELLHTYHFAIATGSNFTHTNILIDHLVTIFILTTSWNILQSNSRIYEREAEEDDYTSPRISCLVTFTGTCLQIKP